MQNLSDSWDGGIATAGSNESGLEFGEIPLKADEAPESTTGPADPPQRIMTYERERLSIEETGSGQKHRNDAFGQDLGNTLSAPVFSRFTTSTLTAVADTKRRT
jgi:hypothetical protein